MQVFLADSSSTTAAAWTGAVGAVVLAIWTVVQYILSLKKRDVPIYTSMRKYNHGGREIGVSVNNRGDQEFSIVSVEMLTADLNPRDGKGNLASRSLYDAAEDGEGKHLTGGANRFWLDKQPWVYWINPWELPVGVRVRLHDESVLVVPIKYNLPDLAASMMSAAIYEIVSRYSDDATPTELFTYGPTHVYVQTHKGDDSPQFEMRAEPCNFELAFRNLKDTDTDFAHQVQTTLINQYPDIFQSAEISTRFNFTTEIETMYRNRLPERMKSLCPMLTVKHRCGKPLSERQLRDLELPDPSLVGLHWDI